MAVAIATIKQEGVKIANPDVTNPQFSFVPDVKNEEITFSLKGINGVNTELAQSIIQNAPYTSMQDFATRMLDTKIIKTSVMIKLIKGGCFLKLHSPDRFETMAWYLRNYCFEPIDKLTMQQMNKIKEFGIIPEDLDLSLRCVNFKQYVLDDEGLYEKWIDPTKSKIPKRGYHDGHYILDENSQPFFKEHFTEDSIIDVKDGFYILSEKLFKKECDVLIQPLRDWFVSQEALDAYNNALFQSIWDKYASGTEASWSMEALCYYDEKHELADVNEAEYGIVNFYDLPEEPEPYDWYTKVIEGEKKKIAKYHISRIAGTVLNSDNQKCSVALLTNHGVVNVKFYKGAYAFYNKQISEMQDNNGKTEKKVLEKSWLRRGNKLLISGIRRDDQYFPLIYKDTIYNHTVNLITQVHPDGTLVFQTERTQVDE